jgi:hypothetical protein
MFNGFEDFQKLGKENVEAALKSADAWSKGLQALTVAAADYSKQTFEAGSAAFEKLLGASSFDKAVEVQSAYMRSAYEGYVGETAKLGEIVAGMAKDAYRPFETLLNRNGK